MHLVVLRPGALGDVLLLRPCLRRLKEMRAGARVTLLAPGERGRLLAVAGEADAVLDLDRAGPHWLYRADAENSEPPEYLRAAFAGAEAAVLFHPGDEALRRAFAHLGVPKLSFHPARPDETASPHPPHAVTHLWKGLAEALGLVPLTLEDFDSVPPLAGERGSAGAVLAAEGLERRRVAVLHPGSGSERKNAPLATFAAWAEALLGRSPLPPGAAELPFPWPEAEAVVVVAGEADGFLGEELAGAVEGAVLLPPLDLKSLAGLLSLAAIYVGNDSGVSHLAAQCGAPTVAFFRASDPAVWRPVGARVACRRA